MAKPIISIGQAVLLILQGETLDVSEHEKLECVYLCGCRNPEDVAFVEEIIHREAAGNRYLQSCEISTAPEVIDADPSRRYFETLLAYETTAIDIKTMALLEVKSHYDALLQLIASYDPSLATSLTLAMDRELAPPWDEVMIKKIGADVYEYFCTITEAEKKYNVEDFTKIKYLISSTLLGVVANCIATVKAKESPEKYSDLPLNIYGTGYYSKERRGRILDEGPHFFSTTGIIKSMGAVPYYNDPVRYEDEKKPFDFKSTSNSRYVLGGRNKNWSDEHFEQLFHPFVNTISGTLLCQLRAAKKLLADKQLVFDTPDTFANYIKCLVASMTYLAGGHSFYEFTYPLMLPEMVTAFSDIPGFEEDMTLGHLFYETNTEAFHNALEKAEVYNLYMITRALMLAEIRGDPSPDPTPSPSV